jgi:hypothetical protein
MTDAPDVKVKLTAEDAGVAAAIKELTSQLKNLKKQQDETAGSGLSLARAFEGIAAAGALLKLREIGKDAFDSAVNIGKMSDKTGQSTQQLSVFHHVAEELGVSTEAVDKALIKAAKSITQFQGGSEKAAQGFAILNIKQKDFIGLNADQKIALVTARLGGMTASAQKATAAQLIFSKGGAEFIPVANAIAGEGFDKITESVAKLGLLLDQKTTDSFRAAKASMQEITDIGAGMATQFEAGLLPAINDVADALLDSSLKGGDGFQELGKVTGTAIKGIAFGFFAFGDSVGAIIAEIEIKFDELWDGIKSSGTSIFQALGKAASGDLVGAFETLQAGSLKTDAIAKDAAAKVQAVWDQAAVDIRKKQEDLFPSEQEEKRRAKERIKRLRPDKTTDAGEVTGPAAPTDAAARAALSLLEKKLEDELAIHRAFAKQAEELDKEQYDQGLLSIREYYERRRTETLKDSEEEIAIVQRGLVAARGAVVRAEGEKKKAATPKDADKQEAARLTALQKVDELETKITLLRVNAGTKGQALNDEEFKATKANEEHIAAFEKSLADLQGHKLEGIKAEINAETEKYRLMLLQKGVDSAETIAAKVAKYKEFTTAVATFEDQEKQGATDLKVLEDQKAAIQDQVQNGKLFQVQADQQILDLYRQQLPALQAIATTLTANAKTEEEVAQAADFQKNVDKAKAATNIAGQQMATLKAGVQSSLTGGLNQFFSQMIQGTQSIGNAFRNLASSVISSIAQMIAQMYIQLIVAKLLKAAMGGFSGGGIVPSPGASQGGTGFAEGGLIRGPGGPKSDSIPARVSPGEYIVKADAVSAFGVHNLEAINRGLKIPSIERLALPKFAEGGLVGSAGSGGDSHINLGIGLDEGLILKHLSSKAAGNIILQHLSSNPKAASKALSRSD